MIRRFGRITWVLFAIALLTGIRADAQMTTTEIARLGRGSAGRIGWHSTQPWLYVESPTGIWVYDGDYNVIDRLDSLPESLKNVWETSNSDPVPENVPDITYEFPLMSSGEILEMRSISPASWSPDGSRFIGIKTGYLPETATFAIFDAQTRLPLVDLEEQIPYNSGFWWRGDKVASSVGIYDIATGQLLAGFPRASDVVWRPDGNLTAISQPLGNTVTILTGTDIDHEGIGWHTEYGDRFYQIAARSDDPLRITFATERGFLNEIDASTGNFTQSRFLHNHFSDLAWSPDNQRIATIVYGSGNYRIAVWDTNQPIAYEPSLIFGGDPYEEASRILYPVWDDGRLAWLEPDVITAYGSNYPLHAEYYGIEQWNLNDLSERRLVFMDWGMNVTYQPNPDLSRVAAINSYNLTFIDLEKSRRTEVTLPVQGMEIDCLCGWSREQHWFANYGKLQGESEEAPWQLHVWDVETGTLIRSIPRQLWNFQTAPAGTLAAGVTDFGQSALLYVLDLATGEVVTSIGGAEGAVIDTFAFNPSGNVLAFSLYGNGITPTLILLDPYTNETLGRTALQSRAWRLAWSPNGMKIAASLFDGTIQVFDV